MLEQNDNLLQHIHQAAEKKLKLTNPGIVYLVEQQGGKIHSAESNFLELLSAQNRAISLLGISELTAELRQVIFEQSESSAFIDSSYYDSTPQVIDNQDSFVKRLLGTNPQAISKLAEIEAKIAIFNSAKQKVNSLDRKYHIEQYSQKIAAWQKVIEAVSASLCSDDQTRTLYQELITKIKDKLSQSTENKKSYEERLVSVLENPRSDRRIEAITESSNGAKIAGQLIDEYLQTGFTLNAMRVLDRIQKPLTPRAIYRKIIFHLDGKESSPDYEKIIKNPDFATHHELYKKQAEQIEQLKLPPNDEKKQINQAREDFVLKVTEGHTLIGDETVDLIAISAQIDQIQKKAEEIRSSNLDTVEKRKLLVELDDKLEQALIPIANKVARIFPHENATTLTEVLEDEEAICAGKVNVLLATAKYLGLNARANNVLEILDSNTDGHTCFECTLPSGDQLVIDANFNNRVDLRNKADSEIVDDVKKRRTSISDEELNEAVQMLKKMVSNSYFVPEESRVLIYRLQKTDTFVATQSETDSTRETEYSTIRVDPYTGNKRVWTATVPHPHQATGPDTDGNLHINSALCNNSIREISSENKLAILYMCQKQIELTPFDIKIHTYYAKQLENQDAEAYLASLRNTNPIVYRDGMDCFLAEHYVESGKIEEAIAVYKEMQEENESRYYQEIHKLIIALVGPVDLDASQQIHAEKARQILESALAQNPSAFFAHVENTTKLCALLDGPQARIAILKECKQVAPKEFWSIPAINVNLAPVLQLIENYKLESENHQSYQSELKQLCTEMKTRAPEYYIANVHLLVSKIVGENEENRKIIQVLEEAKKLNPSLFHATPLNTSALAKHIFIEGDITAANEVFAEAERTNPELFWDSMVGATYEKQAALYEDANEIELAIAIYERAKEKSSLFWTQSPSAGYDKLVILLKKAGRLQDAIAVLSEAGQKDRDFFNPFYDEIGYMQQALLLMEVGQTDEAIRILNLGRDTDEKFWGGSGSSSEPHCMKLVDVYHEVGQIHMAIAVLHELKTNSSHSYWKAADYYKIVALLESSGNQTKAQETKQELIALYEDLKHADQYIYQLYGYVPLAKLYKESNQIDAFITTVKESGMRFSIEAIDLEIYLAGIYAQRGETQAATTAYESIIRVFNRFQYAENHRVKRVLEIAKNHGIILNPEQN